MTDAKNVVTGERLAALGLELPEVAVPVAAYVPAVRIGNLIFTSGQLPMVNGALSATGKLGAEISIEQGKELAQICGLNALAAIATLVDLDEVVQVVKVLAFVASAPGFTTQAQVANGASELFGTIFGDAGKHARSSVGVAELPLGAPVEIEVVVAVRG